MSNMKEEIYRKLKELSDEAGSAAAAEYCGELAEKLGDAYDKRVSAGMSELDAYRAVLANIDEIEKTIKSLEKTEQEVSAKEFARGRKESFKAFGKINTALWLLVVIVYILFSMRFGRWQYTWLIFIWASMGQVIMDMVKDYNKGKPLDRVMRSGFSGCLWLGVTILYFIFSFATGAWATSWVIFLAAAIIQTLSGIFFK